MRNGYTFYFAGNFNGGNYAITNSELGGKVRVLIFPITPSKLTMKVGSNNKVVNLISEGDVNVLKSPSLAEIEFEARFPMRNYPFCKTEPLEFIQYVDVFSELKTKKKSFRFVVARSTPDNRGTWDTNLLVSLEDFELMEDAEDGDDVIINFKLKQYKEYGVKKLPSTSKDNVPNTTSTSNQNRPSESKNTSESQPYVVKPGDCLWNIAKAELGNGAKYINIYKENAELLDSIARKHGKQSSSNGHWIYPGTKIIIPKI